MNCNFCNNNIPDGASFCPFCGASTVVANQQPQEAEVKNVPVDNAQAQQPYYNNQQYAQQQYVQQGYGAYPQANQQQQVYGAYPQATQQNYNNAPGGYPQSSSPKALPYKNANKKMGPGAIIGIVAGGIVGFSILVAIVVALFSIPPEPPRPSESESKVIEFFDFEISDETDEQGRQLVLDYYTGEVIGYVEDGQVHIPHGDDEIICDTDGNVIYHPDRDSEPDNNNHGEEEATGDNGGDYNPPPEGDNGGNKNNNQPTINGNSGKKDDEKPTNKNDKDSPVSGGSSNNVSYDVVEFVDNMFGVVKLHETRLVEGCKSNNYKQIELETFERAVETRRFDEGYDVLSAYMTEDEYNKAKNSFSDGFCTVYKKSGIEKDIKYIWGNELTVEDFLNDDEFVSSKGYVVKNAADGYGDGAEHYWNAFSQEVKGDHIVVKVNMLGYSWYDGSLWDAVKYSDELANIGAENSPSSYTEAIERGSVDESKLSYITIYLKNTDDGLKLDYME